MIAVLKKDNDEMHVCLAIEDVNNSEIKVFFEDARDCHRVAMYDLKEELEETGNTHEKMCILCDVSTGNENDENTQVYSVDYLIAPPDVLKAFHDRIGFWKKSKFEDESIDGARIFFSKEIKRQNPVLSTMLKKNQKKKKKDEDS